MQAQAWQVEAVQLLLDQGCHPTAPAMHHEAFSAPVLFEEGCRRQWMAQRCQELAPVAIKSTNFRRCFTLHVVEAAA